MNVLSIDSQRTFYDQRWESESFANLLQLQRAIAILDALRKLNIRCPKILDFGCGTGWLSAILGRFGPTTGIDLSLLAIEKARQKYPDVQFIASDFVDLEMRDEKFDIVVSQEVIEHVADQAGYVSLAAQFLRPRGYLILTTPNAWNFSHWDREDLKAWGLQPIEQWLTMKQLRYLVESKFNVVNLRTFIASSGKRGIFRVAYSTKVMSLMKTFGLASSYEYFLEGAGFGLHILLVAQRI